ncbi:MAG TPA: hypothetical protein PKI02_00205, partial [Mycobacterium sp.]|nr:hypothetical protein [Mycobacterium sp.]
MLLAGCSSTTKSAPTWVEDDVTFVADGLTLHGTYRHRGDTAGPAALLISESGRTDRNGDNNVAGPIGNMRQLAEYLSEHGVASLRYDKVGTGTTGLGPYAANPADVAAKPWAYLRYRQRGVATPWTDEFPRIYLEFANETWHNGAVSDEWFGWGRSGWVHGGAREFGLAAHFVTSHVRTASPYFSALDAAGKLRFVMGSNYQDYGEIAAAGAPYA